MHPTVSIREAARRLEIDDRSYVKGVSQGMGIPLTAVNRTLAMTEHDYERLADHIARHGKANRMPQAVA